MADTAATREPTTSHKRLLRWVEEVAAMTQPDDLHWCEGSPRSTTGSRVC